MFPQVAEHRHVAGLRARQVVGDRNARQFDNAAFNRIHQRKVAERPWEKRAFGIARATQKKRRGRQIEYTGHAEFAVDGFKPGDPQPRSLVVVLSLLFVVAFKFVALDLGTGLLAVTVMRLIVDDEHTAQPHQVRHDALEHLAFGFKRIELLAVPPLQQPAPTLGQLDALTRLEGVVIRDDDLGALQVAAHVAGHQFAPLVVAVGVIGLQHAQPVFDGQARRDQQKPACELLAVGAAYRIDGLPGNQHRHHGGFASARRELKGQAHQLGIRIVVGCGQVVDEDLAGLAEVWRHFRQPDCCLYSFDLTEKGAHTAERMMPPVLQQACRFGRDTPVVWAF